MGRVWRPGIALTAMLAVNVAFRGAPNKAMARDTRLSTQPLAHFAAAGIAFDYPAGWHVYARGAPLTMFSSLIAHLSTGDLGDPCTDKGFTYTCAHPLTALPRGGVLVTWTQNGNPLWSITSVSGKRTTIDGHDARIQVVSGRDFTCPIHTAMTVRLVIASSVQFNWYAMQACLRGPRVELRKKEVMELVRSVKVTGSSVTAGRFTR